MRRLHGLARLTAALTVAMTLTAGCAAPPGVADGDAGGPGVLHLGEGEREFRAIEHEDTLLLARGCQGSQHVWMTLRTERMDPRGVNVTLSLVRASDEVEVSVPFRLRLSFTADASDDFAQLTGLTLQVPELESVLGQDLLLRGHVVARDGVEATAERRVRIEWGTQTCESLAG